MRLGLAVSGWMLSVSRYMVMPGTDESALIGCQVAGAVGWF